MAKPKITYIRIDLLPSDARAIRRAAEKTARSMKAFTKWAALAAAKQELDQCS